jgi:hypothetical protein
MLYNEHIGRRREVPIIKWIWRKKYRVIQLLSIIDVEVIGFYGGK